MKHVAIILLAGACTAAPPLHAITFDYRGSLQDNGRPADGAYDIELSLYAGANGGPAIGSPVTLHAVGVRRGAFATHVDFEPLPASASAAFVGVRVRKVGDSDFVTLSARSPVLGTQTSSVCPGAWTLAGNAGNPPDSYLGTADNVPLVFKTDSLAVVTAAQSSDASNPDSPNIVLGSSQNHVFGTVSGATVLGGGIDLATCSTQGFTNQSCANVATANDSTVVGGYGNVASGYGAVVAGVSNFAKSTYTTIAGGNQHIAEKPFGTINGGFGNTTEGYAATVAGGADNDAGGDYSFAAGKFAAVRGPVPGCTSNCGDHGTFVWSDSTANGTAPFVSSGPNQFLIRATGGAAINTNDPQGYALHVVGKNSSILAETADPGSIAVVGVSSGATDFGAGVLGRAYAPQAPGVSAINSGGGIALYVESSGATDSRLIASNVGASLTVGGVWANASDRNLKSGFQALDAPAILARVVALPVMRWFYKSEGPAVQHIGPVAQDFHAAFGLGHDDITIGTVDEAGVALAAIQGLHTTVEAITTELRDENVELRAANRRLQDHLEQLSARLRRLEEQPGR